MAKVEMSGFFVELFGVMFVATESQQTGQEGDERCRRGKRSDTKEKKGGARTQGRRKGNAEETKWKRRAEAPLADRG